MDFAAELLVAGAQGATRRNSPIPSASGKRLAAFYRRLASRRGAKLAIIAVAHRLVIAYHLLKRTENYRELGPNHFDNINLDPT